ncbi:hypothetical protein BGZ95_011600 [Linnemannia exigua]|uniref:Uncharacterized protein n=1 Tax=Linnemannia exigua TaxID=604196 RepID=A0AAD4H6B3_9FUNG|nr:hypothetical protein BGZ95_011600 [Linnemannia exigua]
MKPSNNKYDIDSSELPYREDETEYQDQAPHSGPTRSSCNTESEYYSPPSSPSASTTSSSNGSKNEKLLASHSRRSTPISEKKDADNTNNSSEDNDSFQGYEYESSKRPHQRPFYRRRKFWLFCVISTVVFLAIFIPLLLIVILPKVAQAMINSSTMKIMRMNMTNPQETSVQVSVEAAIEGIPSLFAAKVEFLQPAQVFWVREGAGSGQIPRVGQMSLGVIEKKAFAKAQFTQATTFEIADPVLFGEFAKVMMAADTFIWNLKATINVSVIGRTIKDLTMDKTLVLSGLSNFANLKILAFDIPSDAPNGAGALASIQVAIPNSSPIGMSLGTMELDMKLKTAYLGRITAKNVKLIGGQETILHLEGTILRQTDPVALQELSSMVSNYLANTPTTAYGQGVSVLPDGVHPVSWITTAITSTKMSIPLLPPKPLSFIKKINISGLDLKMTPDQPWAPIVASPGISAAFQMPFNMTLNITKVYEPVLTLGYKNTPIADITTAVWNETSSDMAHNNIAFTLPTSSMPIQPAARSAFSDFLISVTQQDSTTFDIQGHAKSSAATALGNVDITVPFNTSLALQGINFGKMKPELNGIVVAGSTVDYVILNATVNIPNPSIFTVEAGPARLHIIASVLNMTTYIGDVLIPNLRLAPGSNPLQAQVHFMPKDTDFRDAFFTQYIKGTNFAASIYGDANSSPIVSLAPVMENLKMSTIVPGMTPAPKLIVGGNGTTSVGQFLSTNEVMLQVQILNPLPVNLWVHQLTADVFWQAFPFGSIHVVQTFPIKPNGIDTSPLVKVQIASSYDFWMFMISRFIPANLGVLTGATVYVDLTAKIIATVDGNKGAGYEAGITYSQNQVGVFLKIGFSLAGMGLGFKKRSDDGVEVEAVEDLSKSTSSSSSSSIRGVYKRDVALMEEHLALEPVQEDTTAYLAWLKRAVELSYPEEAAQDPHGMGAWART